LPGLSKEIIFKITAFPTVSKKPKEKSRYSYESSLWWTYFYSWFIGDYIKLIGERLKTCLYWSGTHGFLSYREENVLIRLDWSHLAKFHFSMDLWNVNSANTRSLEENIKISRKKKHI